MQSPGDGTEQHFGSDFEECLNECKLRFDASGKGLTLTTVTSISSTFFIASAAVDARIYDTQSDDTVANRHTDLFDLITSCSNARSSNRHPICYIWQILPNELHDEAQLSKIGRDEHIEQPATNEPG